MEAKFLELGVSDHSPGMVTIKQILCSRSKPFKFHSYWMKHKDVAQILCDASQSEVDGNPIRYLCLKLKKIERGLETTKQGTVW